MKDRHEVERSYLLAKTAKLAWKYAKGDPETAVSILDGILQDDGDLREHIAVVAIYSVIASEDEAKIGPAVGSA